MQSLKRPGRSARTRQEPVVEPQPEAVESVEDEGDLDAYETFEMFRVLCPDCEQPIALLADEDVLPEHARCPTPWNPFGLQVCTGSGRSVAETGPADESMEVQEQNTALLLTLPQGLDWRMQPFSHVGGPGSRPIRAPRIRGRAA
jgi:hypothetical protein